MAKGAVAAGHPETAKAAATILENGGTAVDAAIAAAFAACAAEPHLVALGAGGFLLVHDAGSGKQRLFDYFVAMPGAGLEKENRELSDLTPTPIDFGGTIQMFHSGHASNGVPGFVAGMYDVHRRFGTIPMKDLLQPAIELAERGTLINTQQEYLHELLYTIMVLTPDSKKRFGRKEGHYREGDRFVYPELAETFRQLQEGGAKEFYDGDLARQIVAESAAGGGRLTTRDLAEYAVVERKPVITRYRGAEIASNPPPSSGGALILHSLALLSHFDLRSLGHGSPDHLRHMVETQLATNEVRRVRFDPHVHDEDVLDRLMAEEQLADDRQNVTNRLGNTTHCSILDAKGNAVAMTNSNGANSGVQVPGTGIQLNSMLGEEDLNPQGFHQHPVGTRIPSMMAPTVVTQDGHVRLATGSAGSNRIRSAVLGVVSNVLDFGLSLEEAVEAPRLHVEGETVEVEGGTSVEASERLAADGHHVHLWKGKNLFFGGAHSVAREDDRLMAHGDSRRGGAGLTL